MRASSRQHHVSKGSETFYEGSVSLCWEQVITQREEHVHIFQAKTIWGSVVEPS